MNHELLIPHRWRYERPPGNDRPPKLDPSALPCRYHERSSVPKDLLFEDERTALHSGKLGDVIYALPTCRALGVNHLLLNTTCPEEDRLRWFPFPAARQMVSLLLSQPYLRDVSIVEADFPTESAGPKFSGVDYNLDTFRLMPRHRIGEAIFTRPSFCRFDDEDAPAHLGEHFAAAAGIRVDLAEPWIFAEPSPKTEGALVVSLTHNWRSYSDDYWRALLKGIQRLVFVGTEAEFARANFSGAQFIPASDHKELAELIAGGRGFLGTVSFPYSLAEGLKVPRLVEICHRNLNAFPVGEGGQVLPPDVIRARALVAKMMESADAEAYDVRGPGRGSLGIALRRWANRLRFRFTVANQTYPSYLAKHFLAPFRRIHRVFFSLVRNS